jgi:beta-galactosidase
MNSIIRYWLFAIAVMGLSVSSLAAESPRVVVDLNAGWRFIKADVPDAANDTMDDSAWASIYLPHTWNNFDGQDGGDNYYRGVGWYRLHLKAGPSWEGKQIYMKFDAASMDTALFVNGKQAGTHSGSFGAFCFDITSLLHKTGENILAVKVSNAKNPNVAPLAGDFTVFGGIYRGVHLLALNPLSISPLDDASSGVYIRQDKVDADDASLTITSVLHNSTADKATTVKCELLDAGGSVVATANTTTAHLPAGDVVPCAQTMTLTHPHLWNARKDPYLYTMRITVLDGATATDVVEQTIGLRFFRVDPQQGFILNGQSYRLYGVNRHQDHLDEGWAITLADHQNDFNNMMELGCTGIRLAHYQQAQEFYDLCDHGGMIAWAEIPIINTTTISPEFDSNASQQLRELIKQSFNHPAICFWGLSNELAASGPDQKLHQLDLQTKLNSLAKELDPTRLTTEAAAVGPGRPQDAVTDIIAFNRYPGWYGGKATDLGAALDNLHKFYPDRGVGLSEFGAGGAISQHEFNPPQPKPRGKWHPEEYQTELHEAAWAAIKPRTWVWGAFIWSEHDFAADQRDEGEHPGRNDKGLVTYDGKTKKDAFYFYKANWNPEPMVHITESRFSPRPAADLPVKLYSNCDSVELKLNGASLGSKTGNDLHISIWPNVELKAGKNQLEATGSRDGKLYTDSCTIVFDMNAIDGHR